MAILPKGDCLFGLTSLRHALGTAQRASSKAYGYPQLSRDAREELMVSWGP